MGKITERGPVAYMKFACQCIAVFFGLSILASDAPNASSVEGVVTLNSMAPLRGVAIGLSNLVRGTSLQAATNMSGYYLFGEVRPGSYTIWADAKGYGCILIPRVVVRYGERVRQDFNFVRGKVYGGCEEVEKNKPK
jgi:Carboxypeptidase regulatory-like domain